MNTLKKTIFLTNKSDKKTNSLCTLIMEKRNNSIYCTIKSYNNIPSKDLILGMQIKNKIIKQNISFENNPYNFILSQNIDLSDKISCVMIDNNNNEFNPILWGSDGSSNYKNEILSFLKTTIKKLNNIQCQTKNTSTQQEIKFNSKIEIPNEKNSISIFNDKEHNEIKEQNNTATKYFSPHEMKLIETEKNNIIANCKEEVAIAQASLFEYDDNEISKIIDENLSEKQPQELHQFYDMISSQLDELFENYPHEYTLEKLIENSKWVKVKYDNDNKSYVVGIIYHDSDIKYICYGVPGTYNIEQPSELRGYSQWLPTDIKDPYTNGYWVMYQDANTGENILIE